MDPEPDPGEMKIVSGLEALGDFVNLDDPDMKKYARAFVSRVSGNVLDSLEKEINVEEIKIDITRYEKGIYFAKIVMQNETQTIKFVVLK